MKWVVNRVILPLDGHKANNNAKAEQCQDTGKFGFEYKTIRPLVQIGVRNRMPGRWGEVRGKQ